MEVLDVKIHCDPPRNERYTKARRLPKLKPKGFVFPEHRRPQSSFVTFQIPSCRSGTNDKLLYLSSELKRTRAKANAVHNVVEELKEKLVYFH